MKTFILVLLLLNISAPHNKAEDVSVASTVRSEQLSSERASQDTSEQEDGSVASTTDSEKPSSEKDTSKQKSSREKSDQRASKPITTRFQAQIDSLGYISKKIDHFTSNPDEAPWSGFDPISSVVFLVECALFQNDISKAVSNLNILIRHFESLKDAYSAQIKAGDMRGSYIKTDEQSMNRRQDMQGERASIAGIVDTLQKILEDVQKPLPQAQESPPAASSHSATASKTPAGTH